MRAARTADSTRSRIYDDQHNLRQLLWCELGQIRVAAKQIDPDHKLLISPSYAKFLLDRAVQIPRSCRGGQHEVALLPRQQAHTNPEV